MDTQKRIVLWVSAALVVGVVVAGAWSIATKPNTPQVRSKPGFLAEPISASDHTKGAEKSVVTIVEYSDFQCPACGANYPLVEEVFAEYKNKISFTYRHFPLPQHKNALLAAYASEAAGKQGKFWEMTDILFKNQNEWSESMTARTIFSGYAEKLGLDIARFTSDMKSDEIKNKVENDKKSGQLSAVDHTPTFFLNGKLATNPRSKEELRALIEYVIAHP